MLKSIAVWDLPKRANPIEETVRQRLGSFSEFLSVDKRIEAWGYLLFTQFTQISSGGVPSSIRSAKTEEDRNIHQCDKTTGNQSRYQTTDRGRRRICRTTAHDCEVLSSRLGLWVRVVEN